MRCTVLIFVLLTIYSCFRSPQNDLESMTEVVLKKHEGIDIRVMPIDVSKEK